MSLTQMQTGGGAFVQPPLIIFLNQHTGLRIFEEKLKSAIKITQFDNLKKVEEEHGFNMGQKDKFFHLGKKVGHAYPLLSQNQILYTHQKEKKDQTY